MNYITVENIAKSYGDNSLFSDISFTINKDQKIALIAKNGSGKTSILNILAGWDTPDAGSVQIRKGINIQFLSQEPKLNPELTVIEGLFASNNPLIKVLEEYELALLHHSDEKRYQLAFDKMEQFKA